VPGIHRALNAAALVSSKPSLFGLPTLYNGRLAHWRPIHLCEI
jgi:hypothetical protein